MSIYHPNKRLYDGYGGGGVIPKTWVDKSITLLILCPYNNREDGLFS